MIRVSGAVAVIYSKDELAAPIDRSYSKRTQDRIEESDDDDHRREWLSLQRNITKENVLLVVDACAVSDRFWGVARRLLCGSLPQGRELRKDRSHAWERPAIARNAGPADAGRLNTAPDWVGCGRAEQGSEPRKEIPGPFPGLLQTPDIRAVLWGSVPGGADRFPEFSSFPCSWLSCDWRRTLCVPLPDLSRDKSFRSDVGGVRRATSRP